MSIAIGKKGLVCLAIPGIFLELPREAVIADTRSRFCLCRIVFVGDRGMVSPTLLDELDHEHIEYIVGVKMHKIKTVEKIIKTR